MEREAFPDIYNEVSWYEAFRNILVDIREQLFSPSDIATLEHDVVYVQNKHVLGSSKALKL